MKSGIYVIDKEKGMTSRDVCNFLSKKFQTKKVGHAGTLDPLATGVLVVAVNKGTKILEFLEQDEKEYIAEVLVGATSDTIDVTGEVEYQKPPKLDAKTLEETLQSFVGSSIQEVPKYSAVHVNGKRLYEYARNQEEVQLPKRKINIFSIQLLKIQEEEEHPTFTFQVRVSKGCYIRSLIRDIGEKLECPCIMKNLRRIKEGIFTLEEAKTITEIEEEDGISLTDALSNYPQEVIEDPERIAQIKNGRKFPKTITEPTCFINKEGELLAIYIEDGNQMKPKKVF